MNKKIIRLTESELHRIIRKSVKTIMESIGDNSEVVFPKNLLGTRIEKETSDAEDVFICGDYHGRYQDDDCEFFVYNIPTRTFRTLVWTTRGYCTGPGPFNTPLVNINDVSPSIQQDILEAAKKEALNKKDEIFEKIKNNLTNRFNKIYSKKDASVALFEIQKDLDTMIASVDTIPEAISLIYNSPYSGFDTSKYFNNFMSKITRSHAWQAMTAKTPINRKPSKIKVSGNDYTGKVVSSKTIATKFGQAVKVGILPEGGGKSIWGIIKLASMPKVGETITLNGTVYSETDRSISLSSAKRIDNVDPSLIVRM